MGLLSLVLVIVGAILLFQIVGSALGVIFMLIVAAIVGFVADAVVPGRLPYGWVGAAGAGLIGAWLGIHLIGVKAPVIAGVSIIPALLGAVIVTFVVEILFKRMGPRYNY